MPFNSRGTLFTTGSGATTPGTAVAWQAAITSFADTGPLYIIQNKANAGGAAIWPAYIRLLLTASTTGLVSLEFAAKVDTPGQSQLPTNSNQFTNPNIANGDTRDATLSVGTLYHYLAAQAMVSPASSASARVVSRARVPTGLGIVGDEYIIQFGQADQAASQSRGGAAVRATDPGRIVSQANAFSIAPGCWCKLYLWWLTAAGAPTFETEIGWYEL